MNHSNCVISAVGGNSLHRMWLTGECNFDLHLVVYDDSMEEFHGDTLSPGRVAPGSPVEAREGLVD